MSTDTQEIERLARALSGSPRWADINQAAEALRSLSKENAELREALVEYGEHHSKCKRWAMQSGKACGCGLDALLAGESKVQP